MGRKRTEAARARRGRLAAWLAACAAACGAAGCASVGSDPLAVPEAGGWRIAASESEDGRGPEYALDGNTNTWWRSGTAEPQWIEADLGDPAMVCGVSLQWGEPHAVDYAVRTSLDGTHWALALEARGGDGGWDLHYFEPILARHVRVTVERGLQGTGAALRTMQVAGADEMPQARLDGEPLPEAMALLDGDATTAWRCEKQTATLEIDYRRTLEVGSIRLDWGKRGGASNVVVETSTNRVDWTEAGRLETRSGDFDALMADRALAARHLRLTFTGGDAQGFELAGIALRGDEGRARPWAAYRLAAARAPEGIYPDALKDRQAYWTAAAGLAPGDAESLLDERGIFAAGVRSPTIHPLLLTQDGPATALQAAKVEHRLANGGAPMPETEWKLASGLALRIRAMAISGTAPALSMASYELANESIMAQTGRLALVVRPLRLPPPWAGGGLAPIYRMRRAETSGGWQELWANGAPLYAVPGGDASFGAAAFDGGDVAEMIMGGKAPDADAAKDDEGLASAAWWIDYRLEPGERARMVVAANAGEGGGRRFPWPQVSGGAGGVADAFDRRWVDATWEWRAETARAAPKIARPDAIDCLQAQVGWLLGLRAPAGGGSTQEGIALRVAALLRAGHAPEARRWIEDAARHMATDGWVPGAYGRDGNPLARVGGEWTISAQGQFIFMAMEYYRFTKDAAFLKDLYPTLKVAMGFLERLRDGAEAGEAKLAEEEYELAEGLLPAAAATAGGRAQHVYADQYWSLLGWKEMRGAASILGESADAVWADKEYRRLKAAVRRSLRAHLERREGSWLPAAAESERFDAVSVALLFWPCGETDLAEAHELQSSLDRFYEEFLRRDPVGKGVQMPSDESLLLIPLSAMGRGDYAREVLYALLARRAPKGWHGWAATATGEERSPGIVGAMPDVRSAAAYVIGTRGLAVRETGRRLDLFSGAPAEWLQHGKGFGAFGLPTEFGPLDLHGFWRGNRMTVEIGGGARPPEGYRVWWPRQIAPERVEANGETWGDFDAEGASLPHDFEGKVEAIFPFLAPWPRDP